MGKKEGDRGGGSEPVPSGAPSSQFWTARCFGRGRKGNGEPKDAPPVSQEIIATSSLRRAKKERKEQEG